MDSSAQDHGGNGKKNKIRYSVTLNRHATNSDLEVGNVEYEYEALLSSPKRRQLDTAVGSRNGCECTPEYVASLFDCMSLAENGLDYI